MTSAAVVGPLVEQMCRMMQQTTAEHDATKIDKLVAKAAKTEGGAVHRKSQLRELEDKCCLLEEEQAAEKARDNSNKESVLRVKCAKQRDAMDGYIKEILQLEYKRGSRGVRSGARVYGGRIVEDQGGERHGAGKSRRRYSLHKGRS